MRGRDVGRVHLGDPKASTGAGGPERVRLRWGGCARRGAAAAPVLPCESGTGVTQQPRNASRRPRVWCRAGRGTAVPWAGQAEDPLTNGSRQGLAATGKVSAKLSFSLYIC